jgi:hypothetical protein
MKNAQVSDTTGDAMENQKPKQKKHPNAKIQSAI